MSSNETAGVIRTVGPLSIEKKKDGGLAATFQKKRLSVTAEPLRMLWILAERPNRMMSKLELYNEMYGHRRPFERPEHEILKVHASRIRSGMRRISSDPDSGTHLSSDYSGNIGIFRSPQGPAQYKERGSQPGIIKQLKEAQSARTSRG